MTTHILIIAEIENDDPDSDEVTQAMEDLTDTFKSHVGYHWWIEEVWGSQNARIHP